MSPPFEDDTLPERVVQGDPVAYREYYDSIKWKLLRRVRRTLDRKFWDASEDIVQEAFVKLVAGSFAHDPCKLTAWLMDVARNAAIDFMRRNGARVRRETRSERSVSRESVNPADLSEREELIDLLRLAISNVLAPAEREVVALRLFEGLTFEAIASQMKLAPGTVYAMWQRSLQRLRKCIEGAQDQEGL